MVKKPSKNPTKKQDNNLTSTATLVTEEGLQKMIDELDDLKNNQTVEIAQKLKEAVAQGDLSENAEYTEAKDQQKIVLMRIADLEEQIRNAKIIRKKTGSCNQQVTIGCSVKVCNLSRENTKETYTIVGSVETDPFQQKISNISPLGAALLGAKKGDKAKIEVPAGEMIYEVMEIS